MRYYGGVDMADRGMADYDVGYRSTRWMMRVVFWCINAVFWNLWVIVLFKAHNGDGSLKHIAAALRSGCMTATSSTSTYRGR